MHANESTHFGGPEHFMTVRHLVLRGSNFEIGQHLGQRARERYGQSPADYAAHPLFARARRAYFQRAYPLHWERMRGVAAAFGVAPDDDRYDLSSLTIHLSLPRPPMGCSVVYYPPASTATGHGCLSRNYDFPLGTIAEVMGIQVPPQAADRMAPVMSEPYIMEWHPTDGGYASLAVHAFDLLSGTLDGINSAGLVVALMADQEAMNELGPRHEPHLGLPQAVGLHELQLLRLVLDTCASAAEAQEALLTAMQLYAFIPCHYLVADKAGHSFLYEMSTGRNVQHILDGNGQPQVVTNFQVHRHLTPETMPGGPPSMEHEAFWRYQTLVDRIARHGGPFTAEDLKANNACVNVLATAAALGASVAPETLAAGPRARTLWHGLYDQGAGSAEYSFYLGDRTAADGRITEDRSAYLPFTLGG